MLTKYVFYLLFKLKKVNDTLHLVKIYLPLLISYTIFKTHWGVFCNF
jgi:hypothetical protein